MKKIIFTIVSILLIQIQSFALDKTFQLVCSKTRPQVMMLLAVYPGKSVHLRWFIEGGVTNLPLLEGAISSPQIPMINYQLEDLKKFPESADLSWRYDQCTITDDRLVGCNGPAVASKNFPYKSLRLSSWLNTRRGVSMVYESWVVSLAVATDSNTYFIPFAYGSEQCDMFN